MEDSNEIKAFSYMLYTFNNAAPDKEDLLNKSSLEVFVSHFYKSTELKTDFEYVIDFTKKYEVFCNEYRL